MALVLRQHGIARAKDKIMVNQNKPAQRDNSAQGKSRLSLSALSDGELLELILGYSQSPMEAPMETAAKKSALKALLGLSGRLSRLERASLTGLSEIPGMDDSRAFLLSLALEVGRRLKGTPQPRLPMRIAYAGAAYRLFSYLASELQEVFALACLNSRNEAYACLELYRGTSVRALTDTRDILREALCHNACRIIVAHNHPSGGSHPSEDDISLTQVLAQACRCVGLPLLDHIIVGGGSYYSFALAQPQLLRMGLVS